VTVPGLPGENDGVYYLHTEGRVISFLYTELLIDSKENNHEIGGAS